MILINGKTAADYNANYIHKEIQPPTPRQEWVEVPLRDGAINAAKYLSDRTYFMTREIKIGFELRGPRGTWPLLWSQLLADFHGKEVKIVFPDDASFFWEGTATVGPLVDNGATAGVTITVTAQPFKRTLGHVVVVRSGSVNGNKTYTFNVRHMRAFPTFETSAAGFTVQYGDETWTLPQGTSTAYGLTLLEGENQLKIHGSGTITIKYQGGAL